MTDDRARKKAVRARMATSGEPYSVAARNVPGGGQTALSELIARLENTLAASSVRIERRSDNPGRIPSPTSQFGRLIGGAARTAWTRLVPEETRGQLRAIL